MATHGNDRMNGKDRPYPVPGAGGDQWHRTLTGRQAPEPVSVKLRMIYGRIVAEKLPDQMLDLLARIDQQSSKQ